MRKYLFSGLLIVLMVSCKKDESCLPFELCVDGPSLTDSGVVMEKMIGSWTELYRPCGWSGDSAAATRKISIELRSDGHYLVRDRGQLYQQGKWGIYKFSNNPLTWVVRANPGSDYIAGKVVFCANNLLLTNSFIAHNTQYDGCLKYYYRLN